MRIAFITESFLPSINGVTNSVLRMLEHLRQTGHEAMVIAPSHPGGVPDDYVGFPVQTTSSVTLPWYPALRLSVATNHSVEKLLNDFSPDVVHLAAPFVLGHTGLKAATKLGVPVVALYQTEVPTYAAKYGYHLAEPLVWRHMRKLHNMATINLAPSTYTRQQLVDHGFARVHVWGRGVDSRRFNPTKRNWQLHHSWAPDGEVVIGYMGRLGPEKQVEDLAALCEIPNTKLVIIGDGPQRHELEKALPQAIFVGMKTGDDLPVYLASLDIFVHPGELETFGQTLQEAQACALPVIAPRKGGPIDIVDSSRNGWLYPPGDLMALRNQVADLVGDDYKRAAFGRLGRERVEARTWSAVCDQLLGYYQQAISLSSRLTLRI
uniref:glycosyltransferase family 4 protein n=1 Tax=Vaginimicrobium propionicum TaxID=1871034 RepID=UPI000970400B|nr:glycosyltransferase family 1 protein [Vaginimicrobium propionicum]